jgi:hypothetical protein
MYRPATVVDSIQLAPSPNHEDLMKDLAKTEQLRFENIGSSFKLIVFGRRVATLLHAT